mmetsp:Transcript_14316/g.38371  ORF Transcript_14316/g.38371 Transcript_14316/m.38371 type:complete len:159 (+) Transcript_14316:153-629(+)
MAFVSVAGGVTRSRKTALVCVKLVPGIPSGMNPRENQPLRSYVPAPVEDYSKRSFATVLPKTWEGEVPTVGAADNEGVTEESVKESKYVPESSVSNSAFVEYARMMQREREAAIAKLLSTKPVTEGRPTCGEQEGRMFVSNYNPVLVEGVKCVEYWRQ